MNEELLTLMDVVRRLETASVPYMLTGSMACSFYAEPRMTRDLDIVVELATADVDGFVALFSADCYVDAETARAETSSQGMFNIIDTTRSVKVDFIVRKDAEYHMTAFARRRQFVVGEVKLWVISAEDLVLAKLLWAKPSHSQLQLRDVRKILASQPELDGAYVSGWADRLGLSELLAEVTHE